MSSFTLTEFGIFLHINYVTIDLWWVSYLTTLMLKGAGSGIQTSDLQLSPYMSTVVFGRKSGTSLSCS